MVSKRRKVWRVSGGWWVGARCVELGGRTGAVGRNRVGRVQRVEISEM